MHKLVPLLAFALPVAAHAQVCNWQGDTAPQDNVRAPDLPVESLRYGPGDRSIRLTAPRRRERAPLIIWLAGVDLRWETLTYDTQWLPNLFFEEGYALAAVTSPREDRDDPEAVARNNAAAIAYLVREADPERIDTSRIILMGNFSGGHFAALLGTDPRYLEQAGVPFASVRGVFITNGEGFDISARIPAIDRRRGRQYQRVFGTDRQRQAELSPTSHLAPPNSPAFLFHAAEGVSDFAAQAQAMAGALRGAGSRAEVRLIPRTIAYALGTYLGTPQHPQTAQLKADLRSLAGLDAR